MPCLAKFGLEDGQEAFPGGQSYSVVGLVVPRTEEQISAPIEVEDIRLPSNSGWKGPSLSPKYSDTLYDQFGGWLGESNNLLPLRSLVSELLKGTQCLR